MNPRPEIPDDIFAYLRHYSAVRRAACITRNQVRVLRVWRIRGRSL